MTVAPETPVFECEYDKAGSVPFNRFIVRSNRLTHPTLYLSESAAIALYEAIGKALVEHTGG